MAKILTHCQYLGQVPYSLGLAWQWNKLQVVRRHPEQLWVGGFIFPLTATLGKSTRPEDRLKLLNFHHPTVACYQVSRGGQILYHHPWQLVIYTVGYLPYLGLNVKTFSHLMLEISRVTLQSFVSFELFIRSSPSWGLYDQQDRKWGFVGLRILKGISQFGCALNLGWSLLQKFWYPKICGHAINPNNLPPLDPIETPSKVFWQWCSHLKHHIRERTHKEGLPTPGQPTPKATF